MILILLILTAVGAIVSLVQLWRDRYLTTTVMAVIAFLSLGLTAFTADAWYTWFGFSKGDGQVFLGYFLIGLFALAAAALTFLTALIVLAVRPRIIGGKA